MCSNSLLTQNIDTLQFFYNNFDKVANFRPRNRTIIADSWFRSVRVDIPARTSYYLCSNNHPPVSRIHTVITRPIVTFFGERSRDTVNYESIRKPATSRSTVRRRIRMLCPPTTVYPAPLWRRNIATMARECGNRSRAARTTSTSLSLGHHLPRGALS